MIDIQDKTPGDPILASEYNALLAELRRLAKWRVAAPLELTDTDAGFILSDKGGANGKRIFVTLANPTGAAGGPGVACDFHYDILDIVSGDTIASNVAMTGNGQRVVVGPTYSPGTIGQGYYNASGNFVLCHADETFAGLVCEEV